VQKINCLQLIDNGNRHMTGYGLSAACAVGNGDTLVCSITHGHVLEVRAV
jgi:hypothetical protein